LVDTGPLRLQDTSLPRSRRRLTLQMLFWPSLHYPPLFYVLVLYHPRYVLSRAYSFLCPSIRPQRHGTSSAVFTQLELASTPLTFCFPWVLYIIFQSIPEWHCNIEDHGKPLLVVRCCGFSGLSVLRSNHYLFYQTDLTS